MFIAEKYGTSLFSPAKQINKTNEFETNQEIIYFSGWQNSSRHKKKRISPGIYCYADSLQFKETEERSAEIFLLFSGYQFVFPNILSKGVTKYLRRSP